MNILNAEEMIFSYEEAKSFLEAFEDILFKLENNNSLDSKILLFLKRVEDKKTGNESVLLELGVLTTLNANDFYRGSGR